MASPDKTHDKKKLNGFMSELLRCSTVKGFLHFTLHPRGREELLLCVKNQPIGFSCPSSASGSLNSSYEGQALSSLPRNEQSLLLSTHTQKRLSGFGFIDVGLPPASPSEREMFPVEHNSTLFLLACYQRYNCPYVWVRSDHERLVRLSGSGHGKGKEDNPLKLRATSRWLDTVIHPWDIMGEVIQLSMQPCPSNPFAVDFEYFEDLPMDECVLATGAMANFLRKILLTRHHSYDHKVSEDLKRILQLHFSAMFQYASAPSGVGSLDQASSPGASSQATATPAQPTGYSATATSTSSSTAAYPMSSWNSTSIPAAASSSAPQQQQQQQQQQYMPQPVAYSGSSTASAGSAVLQGETTQTHAQVAVIPGSTAGNVSNLPPLAFKPPETKMADSPEKPLAYFGTPPSDDVVKTLYAQQAMANAPAHH